MLPSHLVNRCFSSLLLIFSLVLSLQLGWPNSIDKRDRQIAITSSRRAAMLQRGVKTADTSARSSNLSLKQSRPPTAQQSPASLASQLKKQSVFFERNDGQVDSEVLYLSHGPGYTIFLTRSGLTVVLPASDHQRQWNKSSKVRYFRLRFDNVNPQVEVTGLEHLPGISNYFEAPDPKFWHTRIPQFARVRYSNLYPGIDLVFYFRDGQLEYDLRAAPGADPRAVYLQAEGADTSLTHHGDVAIKIGAKEVVRLRKPTAYQRAAETILVPVKYSLRHGKISLALASYDHTQPLVIDPAVIFATFITSGCVTCQDTIADLTADNTGVYLTGHTEAATFPTAANGAPPTAAQYPHAFVVKMDPLGEHVLYSTFLNSSFGTSIAVDTQGSAYVSGSAFLGPAVPAFPLTKGVFSGTIPANPGSLSVAFATKLSPDGATIVYSTFLQQPTPSGTTVANPQVVSPTKIAVDQNGALYVAGAAASDQLNPNVSSAFMPLPVTLGAFQTTPGTQFVLKLNPTASGLDYATYIDGTASIAASVTGLAVDTSGDAFVAGSAAGNSFPTTSGAYQQSSPTSSTNYAGFVMELNPGGTTPVYSTYFGAPGNTVVYGLAIDPLGQAVIAGYLTGLLPATNAFCGGLGTGTGEQGFVVKFTANGSALVYATTLCGIDSSASSVAVDSTGAAYVTGVTADPTSFLPKLRNPIQGYIPPANPGLLPIINIAAKLSTSGALQWANLPGCQSSGTRSFRQQDRY